MTAPKNPTIQIADSSSCCCSSSTSSSHKKVRFPQDQEVTAIHCIERIDNSQREELFYQVEEVAQFRQDYYRYRAQERLAALTMERVNSLVSMARAEMLSKLQQQQQQEGIDNTKQIMVAPVAQIPLWVSRSSPPKRRHPLCSSEEGRAQMA